MVILQYLDTTCCKRQYACSFRTIDVSDYALFGWSASAAGGAGRAALPSPHRYSPHIPTICRSLRSLHLYSLHISALSRSYSLDVYTLFTSILSLSLFMRLPSCVLTFLTSLRSSDICSLSLSHTYLYSLTFLRSPPLFFFTSLVSEMPASLHLCSFHTPTLFPKRSK